MNFPPKLFWIEQKFNSHRLVDLEKRVRNLLDQFCLAQKVRKGQRIAITAGSRGIKDEHRILAVVIHLLKDLGVSPLVIPCMGSHGAATATGQTAVLEELGIAEKTVGAPIVSSMEVCKIGQTKSGVPVLVDRNLCAVDKIIVINRIKPHTHFHGVIEGGLTKMLVIGMGKHQGAQIAHRLAVKHGMGPVILEIAPVILGRLPILFGLGIVENQYSEIASIDLVEPREWFKKEEVLLKRARRLLPSLPFNQIDLLIIDEIGKDISGAGMDTKVIGRTPSSGKMKVQKPRITRIFVRDLSNGTHGNATGIGLADFTTKRLVDKIDYAATHVNCLTSICPGDAKIPIFFETDREALFAAFLSSGVLDPKALRIVWIKNTCELEHLLVSPAMLPESRMNSRLRLLTQSIRFRFDDSGNLMTPWTRKTS
jgi:hypothetical protein